MAKKFGKFLLFSAAAASAAAGAYYFMKRKILRKRIPSMILTISMISAKTSTMIPTRSRNLQRTAPMSI